MLAMAHGCMTLLEYHEAIARVRAWERCDEILPPKAKPLDLFKEAEAAIAMGIFEGVA
jgi:hypothetical protein